MEPVRRMTTAPALMGVAAAAFLAIALLVCLTGCAVRAPSGDAGDGLDAGDGVEAPGGQASFTVGMLGSPSPARQSYLNICSIVEQAGGRVVTEEYGLTPESSVAAVRNLIARGCDGVIIMPMSDASLSYIAKICEDSSTYWAISMRTIHDPRIRRQVEESHYFVGMVMENEEATGYGIMRFLGEQGARKVAAISTSALDTTGAARERGMSLAARELGMEVAEIVRDPRSAEDIAISVESLIRAYPDIDAVFCVGTFVRNSSEAALNAIMEHSDSANVRYAAVDFERGLDLFFDRGMVSVAAGGHAPLDASLAAALLVNALMGTPLGDGGPATLRIDPIMVYSGDELRKYYDVVEDGAALFSPEAARNKLFKWASPEVDVDSLNELIRDYGVDAALEWKKR